jgi:hypothetical protein
MTAASSSAGSRLDIGKVAEQTFAVLGRNFVNFALSAVILVGIPAVLVGFFQMRQFGPLAGGLTPAGILAASRTGASNSLGSTVAGLIHLFTYCILQGAIIYGVVRDMNGQRASLKDCLTVGLKRWWPVALLAIVMGLGIILGFVLLIVPGIMLIVAWSVAIPARVMEGLGIRESFGRSLDLTRGRRWSIFLLFLIVYVIWVVISLVVVGVTGGLTGLSGGFAGGFVSSLASPARLLVIAPLLSVVATLIGTVGITVLYQQLREGREGVNAETLASVFE